MENVYYKLVNIDMLCISTIQLQKMQSKLDEQKVC
jgi:hypothetical protein